MCSNSVVPKIGRAGDELAEELQKLQNVTLAILAGGQATRMGRPKGELLIEGQPILSYLLKRLEWPGSTMLVTAPGREHPAGWEQFSVEVTDAQPLGPLGGILTTLQNASTPIVIVLTVDMPGIEQPHVRWLLQEFESDLSLSRYSGGGLGRGLAEHCETPKNANCANPLPNPPPEYRGREKSSELRALHASLLGVMTTRSADTRELVEPFPSVYRRQAIDIIRRRLDRGQRSVHSLLEEDGFYAVPAPKEWPDSTWTNLNSPADLAGFLNK